MAKLIKLEGHIIGKEAPKKYARLVLPEKGSTKSLGFWYMLHQFIVIALFTGAFIGLILFMLHILIVIL